MAHEHGSPHVEGVSVERITTGPGVDTELAPLFQRTKTGLHGRGQENPVVDVSVRRQHRAGFWVRPGSDIAWYRSLAAEFVARRQKTCFRVAVVREISTCGRSCSRTGRRLRLWRMNHMVAAFGSWSPDGTRLAYWRQNVSIDEGQIVEWSSKDRSEEPLTTPDRSGWGVYDWSPDGKWILAEKGYAAEGRSEVWQIPADAGPHAEAKAQKIIFNPGYFVFQSRFSPDGQWIVFEGVREKPSGTESALYVMRSTVGPWIQITDGKNWDDKPVWSPDGKSIYFVSGRGGFFNVWGVRFDPEKGKTQGAPFAVTDFDRPSLMVPRNIPNVGLSLSQDRLVLTVAQVSGSIWVLDNVGQ